MRQSGKIPFECKDIVATTFQYRYDVHSYHKNYEGAEELDLAVIAALPLQDNTVINGVVFQEIRHVNTIDVFNEDYMLHGKISSFEAIVNEDQAT